MDNKLIDRYLVSEANEHKFHSSEKKVIKGYDKKAKFINYTEKGYEKGAKAIILLSDSLEGWVIKLRKKSGIIDYKMGYYDNYSGHTDEKPIKFFEKDISKFFKESMNKSDFRQKTDAAFG